MMTGLIWMVQLVTYPQFHEVDSAHFGNYHTKYGSRITLVVMPLMLVELAIAVFLVWTEFTTSFRWPALIGFGLVLAIWAVTFLVQVPQHARLSQFGWSEEVISALIAGNWVRTFLWSARSGLLLWWISETLKTGARA